MNSSSTGSDGSFNIRVPTLPDVRTKGTPVRTSSLDKYQIHSGDTDPRREDQYHDDQGYDEDCVNYEEGGNQDEYDDGYYYEAQGEDDDDGWNGYQPDFEPTEQDPVPPPPLPIPGESPRTPPRVGRWRCAPQSSEKGSSVLCGSQYKSCDSDARSSKDCCPPSTRDYEGCMDNCIGGTRVDERSCLSDAGRSNSTTM